MSAGLDCIRDCVFLAFLLSTLKPLFKDVILYCFLMVSITSCLSGFTFCRWLFLITGTRWYQHPAFSPRWFISHRTVATFSSPFRFTENCCFETVLQLQCQTGLYQCPGLFKAILLHWGQIPWNVTPGLAQSVPEETENVDANMKLFCWA